MLLCNQIIQRPGRTPVYQEVCKPGFDISITLEVSQFPIGWLKTLADSNMMEALYCDRPGHKATEQLQVLDFMVTQSLARAACIQRP